MNKYTIKKKEVLRFLVGGGSAVITDYVVYRILLQLEVEISISKAVSFIIGSIVGFIINKLWTFESKLFSKMEIVRYISLYSITAFINAAVNSIVLYLVDIQLIGFLCATGVSTILNFLGQKYFVFTMKGGVK